MKTLGKIVNLVSVVGFFGSAASSWKGYKDVHKVRDYHGFYHERQGRDIISPDQRDEDLEYFGGMGMMLFGAINIVNSWKDRMDSEPFD